MHILHVAHQYPPDAVGGVELYTQRMAQAAVQAGNQVSIFARVDEGRFEGAHGLDRQQEEGVTVFRAWDGPLSSERRYAAQFRTGPLLTAWEEVMATTMPDIVHIQHLLGLPLAIVDQLIAAGVPYVIMLYDYWWRCANAQLLTNYDETVCDGPNFCLNCTRCAVARAGQATWPLAPALWSSLLWRNRWLRRGLAHARKLIVPTPFVADWYAAQGVPHATMQVVPPGVELMPKLSSTVRGQTRSPDVPLRVAYVGSLAHQKGVHVVVEAASQLPDRVELIVAGGAASESYQTELEQLAGPNVRFVGRLGRAEVWSLFASVDVAVVPSIWYETYCYVLHEAFAAGLPVIASDLGVMAPAVRHGVDGLLVPPGDVAAWRDAMAQLAEDRAFCEHLGSHVQPPPDEASHVATVLQIYRESLSGRTVAPMR